MRRTLQALLASTLALAGAFALSPAHARADTTVTKCLRNGQCVVTVIHSGPRKPPVGASAEACSWAGVVRPCSTSDGAFNAADGCYATPADPPPTSGPIAAQVKAYGGSVVWETCPFGGSGGFVWRAAGPVRPQVTDALVRARAVRLVPSAAVGVAPRGVSLVNIETVLWADAPRTQTLPAVTLLGLRVVISLRLDHVRWDFGDGESDGQGPAGRAYDRSDPCKQRLCADYWGHVYARTGRMQIAATASWHASYTVDGGAVHEIAAPVDGPQARAGLQVKQARGVLVPNPGDH